jgi:hypothetical protein
VGAGHHYAHLFHRDAYVEKSVIVFGSMEATLTPLMEQVSASIRRQGVQPAQRGPPGIRPPYRPGRQGRAGSGRSGLPAMLAMAGCCKVDLKLAPNWCAELIAPIGAFDEMMHRNGAIGTT